MRCACGAESGAKKTCERCRLMVANAVLRLKLGITRKCGCGKKDLETSQRRCDECKAKGIVHPTFTLEHLRAENADLRAKLSGHRAEEAKKKFLEESRKAALAQVRASRGR